MKTDKYIPFLKAKSNEIVALGRLDSSVSNVITPFFDFPRPPDGKTDDQFKVDVDRLSRSLKRHISKFPEIYIDTYDYEHQGDIEGVASYYYLIDGLKFENIIPVVAVDRSDQHLDAVVSLVNDGVVKNSVVAFRITAEDFLSYIALKDDLEALLGDVFELFDAVDLIFDCRVCSNFDEEEIAKNIAEFSRLFQEDYAVRRQVVTGSSIPASIRDVLEVNSFCHLERKEIDIYLAVLNISSGAYVLGDYTIVSPNYSDVNIAPEMMQGVMTAKVIYSYDNKHFFLRGGGLRTNGYEQYFDLAERLVAEEFFRGEGYSSGDAYFVEKSKRQGNCSTPAAIIQPSVNAHITYMVNG